MNVCVIPARGGSKRIPRKNIKLFNGKPIIAYSIEAALDSGCFDQVIVSTDDDEIANVARSIGADVPFMRPSELANDHTGTLPVVKDAIEWFEDNNIYPKNVCCIYATAPFLKGVILKDAFTKFQESGVDYCFSVTSFPFPIQRSFQITEKNRLQMFYPEHFNTRSQDLVEAYQDAGQFYWGKAEAFKIMLPLFSEFSMPYILPRYLVQDIDTLEDWTRAEMMYQVIKQSGII